MSQDGGLKKMEILEDFIWENYLNETSAKSVKDKADLDDDGKVSEYEKKRSDAIMKNDDDESNDKRR